MKKFLLFFTAVIAVQLVNAQDSWKLINESADTKNLFENRYKPAVYKIFQLNENVLQAKLQQAPSEKNVQASESSFIVTVPAANGQPERFSVVEAPVMDPLLAAKYPGIKSYAGKGIDDPAAVIRFSYAVDGFHGMIMSAAKKTVYIDPVDLQKHQYVVFSRPDNINYQKSFTCMTPNAELAMPAANAVTQRAADDGRLRTYRLALASTGEYSQYFLNGTETTDAQRKAKVLAAMNTLLTRTNGIYERDFGIRMVLIANNDAIIYLTASTDPWTTEWNTKTQTTIDAVIGSANYDIGHLVHKGSNNGNAGCIGCICKAGQKGSAFTSHTAPEGDPFVVDYTTHEMGHQFGANHTFTFSNESGTASQFEPGSGSTIMGYAGITGATDVQPHSDDYFHARSIEQISDYIKLSTGGGACPVVTVTGNTAPVPNGGGNFTIPKATPFTLTGSATDVDGDALSYTWEQMNAGTSTTTNPSTTATAGPLFRSRLYSTSSSRTFPILASVLDGTNGNQWERLPGVARTLNFRMMVRDNRAGGGNTKDADVVVTVNGTAGPFAVTVPNTALSWAGNSAQTVTWSVNSTNLAPVSCANVKISVSTNGGTSFTTLIASTPNDGSEVITVPNTATTTARIKVEAVGNIFFDISNVNFTISSGSSCANPAGLASSGITTAAATLSWLAVSGANSYDVDYKLNSTTTWTNAATATTSTSVNLSALTPGSLYDWRVRANCTSASSAYTQAQFTTASAATCNAPTGLSSSAVGSSAATISWTAVSGAVSYAVDYKTNPSATWISAATATTVTSVNLSSLTASTLYDWRVRTNCTSLNSAYTQAQFTTTAVATGCGTAFEPNETQATAATIATGVANSAAITTATDVDFFKVVTTATSNNTFALAGPSGVDYDLTIYNSAGTQIGSGAGSTATETVSLSSQAAGTYYIKVFGYSGANSASCYTITATATAVTGCASVYDNTTNGTVAGAVSIPLNTNITGLVNVSGDIDYYKFVITTGGTATITLTTLPADYDLVLYSSNGTTQLAISQNGSTSSETISRTYTAGTYIIKVFGYSTASNATSCYTLKVTTGTATKEAGAITRAAQQFRVYPNPVKNSINLNVSGLQKTGTVQVYDVMGRVVNSVAFVNNGNNRIDAASLKAGIYFIKIIDNNGKLLHQEKLIKE